MEIKVYLVEKLQIVREGFKAMLREELGLRLIGEAVDFAGCDKALLAVADVLMVEYAQPHEEFFRQVRKLKTNLPDLKILIFTEEDDDLDMLQKLLELGISGYLTKHASKEELFHSIRKIHESGIYVCTAFVLRMLRNPDRQHIQKAARPRIEIKPSEMDVLKLIAEGLTNNEIANQLFTSVRTIENRRKKLQDKTNTTNTATLIRFAVKHGLIP